MPGNRVDFGGTMGDAWDTYITRYRAGEEPKIGPWPGDQWGTPEDWRRQFDELIGQRVPSTARRIVEIGPGSGKFTETLLTAFPGATVRTYDVSAGFLSVLQERLAPAVAAGRVVPCLLDANPYGMMEDLRRTGWAGEVDAVCSFDAMVHVDLQYLMAYLLTASATLAPGGVLSLMLADATSEGGFAKLLRDVRRVFPYQGRICQKWEWVSPEIIGSILPRLGFIVEQMRSEVAYLNVVARLQRRVALPW